jgi:hypothetical protein
MWAKIAVALVILVLAAVSVLEWRDHQAAKAKIAEQETELGRQVGRADDLFDAQAELEKRFRESDSTAVEREAELQEQITQKDSQLRAWQARARATADTLDKLMPEIMRPLWTQHLAYDDSVRVAGEQRVAARDSTILVLRGRITMRDSVISAKDLALDTTRTALASALEVGDFWREEAQRGDFNLFGIKLEVTCGVGATVGVGFKGFDGVVGFGCTVGK